MATDTPCVAAMCRPSSSAPSMMPAGGRGRAGGGRGGGSGGAGRAGASRRLGEGKLLQGKAQRACKGGVHTLRALHRRLPQGAPGAEGRSAKQRSAPTSAAMPASSVALRAATLALARRPSGAASSTCGRGGRAGRQSRGGHLRKLQCSGGGGGAGLWQRDAWRNRPANRPPTQTERRHHTGEQPAVSTVGTALKPPQACPITCVMPTVGTRYGTKPAPSTCTSGRRGARPGTRERGRADLGGVQARRCSRHRLQRRRAEPCCCPASLPSWCRLCGAPPWRAAGQRWRRSGPRRGQPPPAGPAAKRGDAWMRMDLGMGMGTGGGSSAMRLLLAHPSPALVS